MIVRAANKGHLEWLVNEIGFTPRADIRGIVAIDQRERVWGGVAYEGWTASSVECHVKIVSPALCRTLLAPAFRYPFIECGRSVITGRIAASNRRSLRLADHLGFHVCGWVRDGRAVGDDWCILQMHRDQCHWLGEDNAVR